MARLIAADSEQEKGNIKMRTHTLLTKVASFAVCLGVLLSGPVMAGSNGIIKDVELSKDGVLYGKIYTPAGKAVSGAVVQLLY